MEVTGWRYSLTHSHHLISKLPFTHTIHVLSTSQTMHFKCSSVLCQSTWLLSSYYSAPEVCVVKSRVVDVGESLAFMTPFKLTAIRPVPRSDSLTGLTRWHRQWRMHCLIISQTSWLDFTRLDRNTLRKWTALMQIDRRILRPRRNNSTPRPKPIANEPIPMVDLSDVAIAPTNYALSMKYGVCVCVCDWLIDIQQP